LRKIAQWERPGAILPWIVTARFSVRGRSAAIECTAAEPVWLFVTLYLYLLSAKGAFSTQPGATLQESGHCVIER